MRRAGQRGHLLGTARGRRLVGIREPALAVPLGGHGGHRHGRTHVQHRHRGRAGDQRVAGERQVVEVRRHEEERPRDAEGRVADREA